MNEKQRWLLRDLEAWQTRQMDKIGRYGPPHVRKDPPHVRAAKRARAQAERVIAQWEKEKKAPWNQKRDAVQKRATAVRRVILFEKTADALKAVKALR